MKNAPVFYTLAQVKFNAILEMDTFVPKIQDRFRRAGYPDFKREITHLVAMQTGDDESSKINTVKATRWSFANTELTSGLLLAPDSLAYHTTAYQTFEVFLDNLAAGLNLVNDLVQLAYTERIGLRYLDAVAPRAREPLDAYLTASVLGLSHSIPGELAHSFCETAARTSLGTLVSRVLIQRGPLGLPPDLLPLRLKLEEKFTAINGEHAILDNDHFTEVRAAFDLSEIRNRLHELHNDIDGVFKLTASDHARKVWA